MRSNFQRSHNSNFPSDHLSNSNHHRQLESDNIMQLSIQSLVRTNKELQEKCNEEKSKNFDLLELKRRLEEEINRLEFQLDRMKNYEHLSSREAIIKSQHVAIQNEKMKRQTQEYILEIKRLRLQVREGMSECDRLKREKEDLARQNVILKQKIQDLEAIEKIPTSRSKHIETQHLITSPQKILSPKSGHLSTLPSYHYGSPSPKLNSRQDLNIDFYERNEALFKNPAILKSVSRVQPLKQVKQDEEIMIKTFQKQQVKNQINSLRDEIIEQLLTKYYKKSLAIATEEKSNSLKIFMNEIEKNMQTLQKMVINYLEARQSLVSTLPSPRKSHKQFTSNNDKWVDSVYQSVKQKTKEQKTIPGLYLGLFRLLTLLDKVQEVDLQLVQQIKHASLKLIYKIKEKQ